ncbi:hypothetical protein EG329_001509 [Mollisiaceae sp. DMI_Dod_QoI]|nr:hypothetical protein EG329_001509 [Helotiales sp. DMI_Dod_QoI]
MWWWESEEPSGSYSYTNHRRQQKTCNTPPKPKKKPVKRPPPPPPCPTPLFNPHHRNLGVKPWASDADVKKAWKHISVRLHPDKIRDPSQREVAAAAMILVNEAYETLIKEGKNRGRHYRWIDDWVRDPRIDNGERRRRREESGKGGVQEEGCEVRVGRKPVLWGDGYKTYAECENEGTLLCGEFWVDASHAVIDRVLPLQTSDWIWEWDKGWKLTPGASKQTETLQFFGNCYQQYKVTLPVARVKGPEKKWSHFHDTECAKSHLDMGSVDGSLLIAVIAVAVFLLRKVLVKRLRDIDVGVSLVGAGTKNGLGVVDRGVRKFSKILAWFYVRLVYLSVWALLCFVTVILLPIFLVPNYVWEDLGDFLEDILIATTE